MVAQAAGLCPLGRNAQAGGHPALRWEHRQECLCYFFWRGREHRQASPYLRWEHRQECLCYFNRTGMPRPRRKRLASLTEWVRKWKIEAAKTAWASPSANAR